jgi:hypothetical protein
MIEMQRQLITNSTPASVFAYLADFTTTEQWDPGCRAGAHRSVRLGQGGSAVRQDEGRESQFLSFAVPTNHGRGPPLLPRFWLGGPCAATAQRGPRPGHLGHQRTVTPLGARTHSQRTRDRTRYRRPEVVER